MVRAKRKNSLSGWGMAAGIAALPLAVIGGVMLFSLAGAARSDAPRPAVAAPVAAAKAAPKPAPQPAPAQPKPADPAFVVKRILDIKGPIKFGDYYWNADDVPQGPVIVTVDLEAQTLSIFRDGYEIGATAIAHGIDGKATPLGVYPVTEKDADHVSNLYDAPMPYMLRLTNDGISVHGSEVADGNATHGCIGVPTPFAKLMFDQVKLGDLVIVTRGKRLGMGQAIVAKKDV